MLLVFFLTALLVVTVDQLTKSWIRSFLPFGASIPPSGLCQITHVRNTGAVFGILPDQTLLLTIAAIVGAVVLLVFALNLSRHFPYLNNVPARTALGLVLGGTLGNLIDRLRFGYVTDFISFGVWPAFNIADSAVTVGTAVFAYFVLRWAKAEKSSDGRDIPSGS